MSTGSLSAQTKSPKFRFEHITVDDGLAHSDAMDVVQGSRGFIWIATNNGVDRFDGYHLKHYQMPSDEAGGVTSNRLQVLYTDLNGILWAGTEDAGLFFYDQQKDLFRRPEISKGVTFPAQLLDRLTRGSVRSIAMDDKRRLWVATLSHGVFCIETKKNASLTRFDIVELADARNEGYTATSVFTDSSRDIWIGTLGKGLWKLPKESVSAGGVYVASRNNYINESDIRVIRRGRKGEIWVASDHNVYRFAPHVGLGTGRVQRLALALHGIQCLYSDSYGHFWIGTNFGLNMIEDVEAYFKSPDPNLVHHYNPKDSDPWSVNSGRIHQIMEDSFGNLWLAASAGGLNKVRLQSKGFHHMSRELSDKSTLTNNFVNAIYRDDRNGQVWIGTRNGYSVYDEKTGVYQNFLSRSTGGNGSGVEVSSFCLIGDQMWIGTRYSGLYRARTGGLTQPQAFTAAPGHAPWNYLTIESIVSDSKGQIWIGTVGGGLNLFSKDGRFIRRYDRYNSPLPTDDITFLMFDSKENMIWASTRDEGVLKLREHNAGLQLLSQFKYIPGNSNSLKVNFAWPLLKDADGSIWVGTIGGGLHKITRQGGKETVKRYQHLIDDNDIEGLLADGQGNIWLSGAGLKKFNPRTGDVIHYDVSDGLQGNSFKVGAAFRSTSGTMYFGGINGLTWFQPEEIRPNPLPPLVRITGLRVLNKDPLGAEGVAGSSMVPRTFSESEGVVIRADENDFLFEFVGLNYVNPQKQSYAFLMEGYSKDWIQLPDGQRIASFANLPAGEYIFKVKANNGEGVWSDVPASIRVKVLPPWWQTWWAYTLYFLVCAMALFWYRRLTTSRLRLENKLALEKLKSDNEREMADMKANFFTGVSHEFRTPLTLILGPMEEFMNSISGSESMREKVLMMHKQTRKLLDLVNQLLSFRKVESGAMQLAASRQDIVVLVKELFSIFRIKADELQLDYSLHISREPVMAYVDAEKLEVVVTNLLSNAFKHTNRGGSISLEVRIVGSPEADAVWEQNTLSNHFIEISVSDTGAGIAEEDKEKIFDPYFQASRPTSGIRGSGIGLALVKEFVKRHYGEILVSSEVGKGSTFVVRLPFGKKHLQALEVVEISTSTQFTEVKTEPATQTLIPEVVKNGTAKILIVEDNADLRLYLGSLFDGDYQVILSADGADGWEKVTEILPDVVISDVNMPGMNGLDLSKKIKQNLKTTHIPVVLLTARAAAVQELEGLETGADDYIVKPFNEEILKAKIHTLLVNRGRLQEYYQRQILLQPTEIVIPDEDRIFLETAMKIVEANLSSSEFNVQSLVTGMNMSQSVFYRRIKNITGQTVIEFIKDIRLKRAAQLLTNQHARVSEVAFMVGIEDPKNFRVSFQKRYNMSPSQYAKEFRQHEHVTNADD